MNSKVQYYLIVLILILIVFLNAAITLVIIKGTGGTIFWKNTMAKKEEPFVVSEIINIDIKNLNSTIKIIENNNIIAVLEKLYVRNLKEQEIFKMKQ